MLFLFSIRFISTKSVPNKGSFKHFLKTYFKRFPFFQHLSGKIPELINFGKDRRRENIKKNFTEFEVKNESIHVNKNKVHIKMQKKARKRTKKKRAKKKKSKPKTGKKRKRNSMQLPRKKRKKE